MSSTAGWPWPGDSPIQIARKVAHAYRAGLGLNNRDLRDQIDQTMVACGQGWVVAAETRDATEDLTTTEAAAYVSVSPATIRQWACTPHPRDPGRMLLPRFGRRGRERTYLAVHVTEAAQLAQSTPISRRKPDSPS